MDNLLILPCDASQVSDGYHTFEELYEHRHLLFINLLAAYPYSAFKTRRNQENTELIGWFIAGLDLSFGQLTYHLPEKYWSDLDIREKNNNEDYDGHSSDDVLKRLNNLYQTATHKV
ncbi:WDGH domain-containing protein [Endozoicomonas ascidiicola]|uniref:WDGH domain-containing protein n=1 Tax=Endozoicomonas ascidiicola TaxID=1698521 RepID=UPI0008326069|nr:hypothetical protein [Endozoicomonas ascidiicola]